MKPTRRAVAIKSPQNCIFKWTVDNVLETPRTRFSPLFEMLIDDAQEKVRLELNNNRNFIQISIQPINKLDLFQLVTFVSDASLIFRYGANQSKQLNNIKVRATSLKLIFTVSRIHFTTVTNDYKDPFEVEVHLNLQPISQSQLSGVSLLTIPSTTSHEPPNDLIQIVWKINDVNRLPLIKMSPLFSFNVCGTKHQIALSMETNNDRIQLRISSLVMHVKKFALSIDQVSLVLQTNDDRPPTNSETLKVQKVIKDLIYLTTLKRSFAELTENHSVPLTLTLQFEFRETSNTLDDAIRQLLIGLHSKPKFFNWKVVDFKQQQFMKTSPWFKTTLPDNSALYVQFFLKQEHNKPIQIGLKTAQRKKELALSIDRVSIRFTDAKALRFKVKRVVPQLIGDLIYFDLAEHNIFFNELTNEYTNTFEILFKLHPALLFEESSVPMKIQVNPYVKPKELFTVKRKSNASANQKMIVDQKMPFVDFQHLSLLPVQQACPPVGDKPTSWFAPNPQSNSLLHQLNTLLVSQDDCDVFFDCQGTRIGAHRSILQTRCGFFKELMQQHDDQSSHELANIDAQTMADTLQFLYTETAPQIANTAERLLEVAKMMNLPELQELAQQQLVRKASLESSTSAAKLLDLFEVNELQPKINTFIQENLDELLGNSQFEQELKQRSDICYKLITSIARSTMTQN